jgi:MFS family permease
MSALPVESQQIANIPTPPKPGFHRRWALAMGLYSVGANAGFSNAVWLIYLASHGYSPFAIGLFEMLFHVAKFLAEVPTGIFADIVGRRASLIACCALGCLSSLFYLAPGSAWLIAAGFALSGLSSAFRGGAESAMVWHLAERSGAPDKAAQFSRFFSRLLLVGLIALALSEASCPKFAWRTPSGAIRYLMPAMGCAPSGATPCCWDCCCSLRSPPASSRR